MNERLMVELVHPHLQVALTARYWTRIFVVFVVLSYVVAYIFLLVYMWVDTVSAL